MEIFYSSRFERDFRGLAKDIQKRAIEREEWFRSDIYDSRLKTHPLKGPLAGVYSFSVSPTHRILFEFGESKAIVHFLRIGNHDIYN